MSAASRCDRDFNFCDWTRYLRFVDSIIILSTFCIRPVRNTKNTFKKSDSGQHVLRASNLVFCRDVSSRMIGDVWAVRRQRSVCEKKMAACCVSEREVLLFIFRVRWSCELLLEKTNSTWMWFLWNNTKGRILRNPELIPSTPICLRQYQILCININWILKYRKHDHNKTFCFQRCTAPNKPVFAVIKKLKTSNKNKRIVKWTN